MLTSEQKKHWKRAYKSMPYQPRGNRPTVLYLSPIRFYADNRTYWRVIMPSPRGIAQYLFSTVHLAYQFARAHRPDHTEIGINRGMYLHWHEQQPRDGWECMA